jgi:hypothetical protein
MQPQNARNPPSGGFTRLVALNRATSAFRVSTLPGWQVGVGLTQLLMQDQNITTGALYQSRF